MDLIINLGLINFDFVDVKIVMVNKGNVLMGIGIGFGEECIIEVVWKVIYLLFFEIMIDGVEDVIVNVIGGMDMIFIEVEEVLEIVS